MRQAGLLLLVYLPFLFYTSCTKSEKVVDEGIIKYEIDYMDYDKNNILLNIMPEKMTVKFQDDNTRLEIESIYGVFKFAQISNKGEGENITLLKIMDKKYKYEQDIDSIAAAFAGMRNLTYNKTPETKEIAGYPCQKAMVHMKRQGEKMTFPIYSTDEIFINQPNKNNPFSELNEVLMEFQLTLNDMRMRLKAKEVSNYDIKASDFKVPSDYKKVTKEEMQEIISRYTAQDES